MSTFRLLFDLAAQQLIRRVGHTRIVDFVVGGEDNPYLLRWYLTPWRRWQHQAEANPTRLNRLKARIAPLLPNAYLHCFLRDDDDRALHDHPWAWCSILLQGSYIEHTIAAGGIHRRQLRGAPSIKVSGPRRAHRVELVPLWWMTEDMDEAFDVAADRPHEKASCWTLFITGPRVRVWGFHCPEQGWVDWQRFTDPNDTGKIGRGCEAANDNNRLTGKGAA
jgi:hypothetical protein